MQGDRGLPPCAVSPDGTRFVGVTADLYKRLQFWDTGMSSSPSAIRDAFGLHGVTAAAFSPDGRIRRRVATTAPSGFGKLGTSTQLGAPPHGSFVASVTSLDFSPDGTKFVSASVDGTLREWPVPHHLHRRRHCAPRLLTIWAMTSGIVWSRPRSTTSKFVRICRKATTLASQANYARRRYRMLRYEQ